MRMKRENPWLRYRGRQAKRGLWVDSVPPWSIGRRCAERRRPGWIQEVLWFGEDMGVSLRNLIWGSQCTDLTCSSW